MKRLTLIRHAKASRADSSHRDFDRPLSPRGKQDAPGMGRRLAARGILPDAVVSSPAKRARSTARKVSRELGFEVDAIREEKTAYEATAGDLLDLIRSADPEWEHVFLVAHNPGLSDLASLLVPQWTDDLPTCAVLGLGLEVETWEELAEGTGTVLFYDTLKGAAGE